MLLLLLYWCCYFHFQFHFHFHCQYTPKFFFNPMSLLIESDVTNSQVGLPCPLSHRLHISRQENHAGQPFSKQEFCFSIGRISNYNRNINTSLLINLFWMHGDILGISSRILGMIPLSILSMNLSMILSMIV